MGQKMPAFQINMNDLSKQSRWYTIVTKTNYEYKFERDLKERMIGMKCEDYIEEIFVPIKEELSQRVLKSGKIKNTIKQDKIYPAYVFVKAIMNEEIWNLIRKTPGCATILATGETLVTMSDYEINEIKKVCTKINLSKFDKNTKIEVNDRVIIKSGSFEGLSGLIKNIEDDVVLIRLDANGLDYKTEYNNLCVI